MMFFGGEKYSKEAYKEAVSDKNNAEMIAGSRGTILTNELGDPRSPGWRSPQQIYDALGERAAKAAQKVEKLHGKGQAEAIATNKEYDRLMATTLDAVKALLEFEKNKLGMSEEETKS